MPELRFRFRSLSVAVAAICGTTLSIAGIACVVDVRTAAPRIVTVDNCAGDSSPGTLRLAAFNAADADEIDITCSPITFDTGAIAVRARNVAIVGKMATPTVISSQNASRVFEHYAPGIGYYDHLTLQNLAVKDGSSSSNGGCVHSLGSVDLKNSSIENCHVTATGLDTAYGGGVFAAGTVGLYNSTISSSSVTSENGVAAGGGAWGKEVVLYQSISFDLGATPGTGSSITGSSAISTGTGTSKGGCINAASTLWMYYSTINGCTADSGGGIWAGGLLVATESTISGNTARSGSGGIFVNGPDSLALLIGSTLAFNKSGPGAAALFADNVTVEGSIVADSQNYDGSPGPDLAARSSINSYGIPSIVMSTIAQTGVPLTADILVVDPLLAPLANSGGATLTHGLLSGSPALQRNTLSNTGVSPRLDQRGFKRPKTHSDIGAVQETIFADPFES